MPDHVTEELISAYLDNEVSEEERRLVEQALADSSHWRQLLDTLRTQQAALRELPRYGLPDDFSTRVLARLERQRSTPLVAGVKESRDHAGGSGNWNSVLLAAAGMAALLLLTFFTEYSTVRPERPIARQPGSPMRPSPPDSVPWDWAEQSLVYYVPESNRRPRFSLLVDVTLTPLAQQNRAFEKVLTQAGVRFDPDLKIDERLKDEVLGSRLAADVEAAGGQQEPQDEVELTYMVCEMRQFDDIYFRMAGRRAEFAMVRLDMVKNSDDLKVFFFLNDASRTRFARQIDAPDKRTLAHRLVFNVKLRSSSLGFLGKVPTPSLEAELLPADQAEGRLLQVPSFLLPDRTGSPPVASVEPDQTPGVSAVDRPDRPERNAAKLDEEQGKSEILFLLRKLKVPLEELQLEDEQ